jgi:hypothetical protein
VPDERPKMVSGHPVGLDRAGVAGSTAADQVEQSAEPAVRVASAGFELHREHEVFRIVRRPIPAPAVGEQTYAVPGERFRLSGSSTGRRSDVPVHVHLDDLLRERDMTLTELSQQIGLTLANLSILKTGKARRSGSRHSRRSARSSSASPATC